MRAVTRFLVVFLPVMTGLSVAIQNDNDNDNDNENEQYISNPKLPL